MSPRSERASGLLSAVIGVGVVTVMLGVCTNVAVGLWTRSVVDAVAYDAARDVATAPPGADPVAVRASAIERARAVLGDYGRRVSFEFESAPDADHVVLRVHAAGKHRAAVSGDRRVDRRTARPAHRRSTGSAMNAIAHRARSQRGAVGGLEALLLGFLVLFGGAGLMVNSWAVIETRTALDAAAREYLRAYTSQSDPTSASLSGAEAVDRVLRARGTPLRGLTIDAPEAALFGPCQAVEVTLSIDVTEMRVPFIDALGPSTVSVTTSELVDAHREMVAGTRHDLEATPCGG